MSDLRTTARGRQAAARPAPGRRTWRVAAAGAAATLAMTVTPAAGAVTTPATTTTPVECATSPTGAVLVTPDCVDPLYAHPVVDSTADVTTPVPHREVLGHFEGTTERFEIHLPPVEQWEGRFFQLTYPLTDEQASDDAIAFGAASGAYTVQAGGPPPVLGYRHAAAAAKFAETVAADYYGSGDAPIHGYLYGGSGGSFQTIGAAENTTGVWDGFAPQIVGVPMSAPYTFFIRAMADLVLRDDAPGIADAVLPGGSGDPYAGLDEAEQAMLAEITSFGVPLDAWQDPEYLLGRSPYTADGLLGFGDVIRQVDPTYADDFWTQPGYLGTEQSPLGDVVRAALVDSTATVQSVEGAPATAVTLTGAPATDGSTGLDFTVLAADGTTPVGSVAGVLDSATGVLTLEAGAGADVLAALVPGARVRVDNRWDLALRTYYRHQVPPASEGYAGFAQFQAPDGTPRYPQRAFLVGPSIQQATTGGATYSGRITGKMIVVDALLDVDAPPFHADWYAQRVRSALGDRAFADGFRVYVNDAADHQGARAPHLVDWTGATEQALRDLAAWVEDGVAPPASTRYAVDDAQVTLPARANQRRGVQPVVDLAVRGRERIDVVVGQRVTFTGSAMVPAHAGQVVRTAWDFAGTGEFTETTVRHPRRDVTITEKHRFTEPGTYYVSFRATSNRSGDPTDPFADVQSLDRVRVVVHPAQD